MRGVPLILSPAGERISVIRAPWQKALTFPQSRKCQWHQAKSSGIGRMAGTSQIYPRNYLRLILTSVGIFSLFAPLSLHVDPVRLDLPEGIGATAFWADSRIGELVERIFTVWTDMKAMSLDLSPGQRLSIKEKRSQRHEDRVENNKGMGPTKPSPEGRVV